jgi:hypothetical protein
MPVNSEQDSCSFPVIVLTQKRSIVGKIPRGYIIAPTAFNALSRLLLCAAIALMVGKFVCAPCGQAISYGEVGCE